MSIHGYDPGDRNNWYQSPQLGLFPASPTGYGGGYYCLPSYLPHGTQFPSPPSYPPPPSQFSFQPGYSPPPPPPSPTIINGYVFPHQFPSSHTYHSPDSNPNPWIYPSISQSLSYDPSVTSVNSHFVSTKTMPTPPISHSAPSPPVCEQLHTISYPNPFCPIPVSGPSRISLHTDRIHNGEVPIVDSGGYSLIPEPKGAEKPHSPPQGSGKLQKSLQSSMDSFISEFREELRLLRGSLPSPASQVDDPLKFGSPPPSSTLELIPAATEASSSSLIPAANGIIRKTPVDSDLILSSTDVILGFSDNASMNHVVGSTATTSIATLVCGDKSMEVVGGVNTSRKIDKKGVIDGFNPDKSKEFQELLYDSAFNIVGYNPFVNLECGPANSAWLENIQRSAVLPQVAQLKLPRNKWESLYEQMVLEMIELRDIETARSILRNTQVTGVLKQEQPERYLQLQHLHAGTYFDPNEAYPDSTKEQRHAQTARALAAEVIVVPPSRLMILICQALERQQHRGFHPPGPQSDLFRGIAAVKQDVDDLYRITLRHTSKFRTKSHAECARFSPDGQFLVATMRMKDVTAGNLYLIEVVALYLLCQTKAICQPRRFSGDEVIDFVKSNSELSFMWYYCDPLLSRDYGVFLMTNMNKSFQYVVRHVHTDMLFLATSSSIFYSPFHALVRKLLTSSPMASIHLLRPTLAKILREDEHYIIGIVVLISINQLVSLKSKKQGLEIMYGDVYNGHYCSHVSCSLYFLDFMITWFIEFGFVAIVSGDLALVPQNFFSVPMQSNEAPLLILLTVIMYSQIMEFVISSHLLHCPNREALRVFSNMQNSYQWQSNSNSHVSVHLCALIHTWQVTTEDGIAFGAALTNIKDLNMIYPTLWYIPLFTCDNPKVVIEMDVAASEFYGTDKTYDLTFKEEKTDGSRKISGNALEDVYKSFVTEYPLVSIYDSVDQDDWEPYSRMTAEMGEKVQNFEGAISTWGCSKYKNETQIMLHVPQVECKVDGLVILPFLYKPVVDIASQRTLVFTVPTFSVILRDYASRKATIVIFLAPASCFAKFVQGISTTPVLCNEYAARHALHFVKDDRTRFNLALESGNIQISVESATAIDEQDHWYRLGVEALRQGSAGIVTTLNALLNDNTRCLPLENKLEKVSLLLTDKLEKMDEIVKMMFDLKGTRESLVLISKKQEWKQLFSGHNVNYLKVVASVVIGFPILATWHLIKGVKEDSKTEIIAALCKDVEGLSLTRIATETSYFYGKTLKSDGIAGLYHGSIISCVEAIMVIKAMPERRLVSPEVLGVHFLFSYMFLR